MRITHLLAIPLLILTSTLLHARRPPIPDFTKGGKTDGSHDWVLGSTGASGWIYAYKHTDMARQILITTISADSPAHGKLKTNDVILGIGKEKFTTDARITLAKAITKAETKKGAGKLPLLVWRDGKTSTITLQLPILGSYSSTAPYNCPKSLKILTLGCQAIAKRGLKNVSIDNNLNALALLASGDSQYLPLLKKYASKVADYEVRGMATWHYGYALIFLAEYQIATNDQTVLPGLKRLALLSARGQSKVGTWSHGFSLPDGRPSSYGAMNSPGLTLTIGMALAQRAGIKDPVLDKAVKKSAAFLRWYLDKGAIPYGDHVPWTRGHEDNGKCSMAAVLFDLLEDREATDFFARMSTAGYDERERGHTGNFFNIVWAMPGTARSGQLATHAYWREHYWYYDLARNHNGFFRYQGSPVGEEEHKKYTNWDNTGTYLLAYALPLRKTYITGKKDSAAPALTSSQTNEVIDSGRGFFNDRQNDPFIYSKRPEKLLLESLSSWSPFVRLQSAKELGRRQNNHTETLLPLLKSKTNTPATEQPKPSASKRPRPYKSKP